MNDAQKTRLTATELAKELKVSTAAVRKWTTQGMNCERIGKRLVRFDIGSAVQWLRERAAK